MPNVSEKVLQFINQTQQNIFLTGKAGTGKTTLLHKIISETYKNTAVVAPTGIAALNARGVTIHSFFQLPFASFLPNSTDMPENTFGIRFENQNTLNRHFRMHKRKQKLIQNLELLIIDEVSMLRADVIDAMDYILRKIRKNKKPFGGVQVLFIGDLLQLPPVVKNEEWEILKNYYSGMFFFHSNVIQNSPPLYIELEKVYRQSDANFLQILNHLRNNTITTEDIEILNQYLKPNFSPTDEGYITLTTHNAKANRINERELDKIAHKSYTFKADIVGNFPEYMYPMEENLVLKRETQVMFIKNDVSGEQLFYNGKMGKVHSIGPEGIWVVPQGETQPIEVEKYEWQNVRYQFDEETNEIKEEVLGTFTQYPIRTAWAITVHKSQGLTFEKAVLDVEDVFAPGQAYVALSRLRSLDGLVLLNPIRNHQITNPKEVIDYAKSKSSEEQLSQSLKAYQKIFLYEYLQDAFSWQWLADMWRLQLKDYQTDSKRGEYKEWANQQSGKVEELFLLGNKFRHQISSIFKNNKEISHLEERIESAYRYFYPHWEDLLYQLMRVQAEISGHKKIKQFSKDLEELETQTTYVLTQLLKAHKMVKYTAIDKSLNKENINANRIAQIRENLRQRIYDELKSQQLFVTYNKRDKKVKIQTETISTYEKTFLLWQKGKTIQEIAEERKLTEATILRHIGKLIKNKKLKIEDVMPKETIKELTNIFDNEDNIALGHIREITNEKYSWDELRLFKETYFD